MHPRFNFVQRPTPLQFVEIPRADRVRLALKNDGHAGILYGGNKVRKLEYLLADAASRKATRVATCGAIGSNHCLATALYANKVGIKAELHHFPQEVTDHVRRNILALATLDVDLRHHEDIEDWLAAIRGRTVGEDGDGSDTYWIPAGGTTPLGALGFVDAAVECVGQYRSANEILPDFVYVPVGTAGTLIGLALGFALEGAHTTVVGVRVTPTSIVSEADIGRLGERAAQLMRDRGQDVTWADALWTVRADLLGAGYGVPTEAGQRAIAWADSVFGIALESTYTAKCVAALMRDLNAGQLREKGALYWYTLNQVDLPSVTVAAAKSSLPSAYHRYL